MADLRFNHFFAGLMGLSFVTAFTLPSKTNVSGTSILEGLYSPVSRPIRAMAGIFSRRFHSDPVIDPASPEKPRPASTVYEENEILRSQYASLVSKFDQLSQLNADRQAVGDIRRLCKPATVVSSDSAGVRETLEITSVASEGLQLVPVIRGNSSPSPFPCDVIGRVIQNGPVGAKVLLVTDPGSIVAASIAHYQKQEDGQLKLIIFDKLHPLIRGIGHNAMAIASNLSMVQVQRAGISVNDLILLDDREWPFNVQGFEVGRIVSITRQPRSPLLADIRIEPQVNLMRLTDVMVMVHG